MAIGIVAEYNPFHNGHLYHIEATRRAVGDLPVVAVMSGDFVQRGDFAIADKFTRAKAAVSAGAVDLIIELPAVYTLLSAEGFARAAVALLEATGVVDTLSFGSECGDLAALSELTSVMDTPAFNASLIEAMKTGAPYAAARQSAVQSVMNVYSLSDLLLSPNNTLGVEYLRALKAIGSRMQPFTVQRCGAPHDGDTVGCAASDAADAASGIGGTERPCGCGGEAAATRAAANASAAYIRTLWCGGADDAAAYMPAAAGMVYAEASRRGASPVFSDIADRSVMSRLRRLDAADYRRFCDVSEGLENRITDAVARSRTRAEAASLAQCKRYPLSRIRRALLRAYLGIPMELSAAPPPYLRVLALSERGRVLLRRMKHSSALPVITKPSKTALSPEAKRVFDAESLACDLYNLAKPSEKWHTAGDNYRVSPFTL